jgi:hypothetical protein
VSPDPAGGPVVERDTHAQLVPKAGQRVPWSGRRDSNPRPPPWQGRSVRPPPFACDHPGRSGHRERSRGRQRISANGRERRGLGPKMGREPRGGTGEALTLSPENLDETGVLLAGPKPPHPDGSGLARGQRIDRRFLDRVSEVRFSRGHTRVLHNWCRIPPPSLKKAPSASICSTVSSLMLTGTCAQVRHLLVADAQPEALAHARGTPRGRAGAGRAHPRDQVALFAEPEHEHPLSERCRRRLATDAPLTL